MAYEFVLMNSKNHNSDFRYEFIYELYFYPFTYLGSSQFIGEFMVSYKKHPEAAQYNQPIYL